MRVFFLANPQAAGRRAVEIIPRIRDVLRRQVDSLDSCEVTSGEDLRRAAKGAAQAGYDRVLVAGGDGTAHAALNVLAGTETALGVVPLGHGNDLARALGVPLDPLAAAEFLVRAPVGMMDAARFGEQVYACVAGVGFDAETNRRANAWGGWLTGHTRYFAAALRTLVSYKPMHIELVSDTEDFSGDAMWVAVANTPNYGGGVRIAPEARVDDGLLDICVIEPLSAPALLRLYPRIRRGEHLCAACVRYFRAARVEFRGPAGAALYGDGEFLGSVPLEIRVQPQALRVVRRAAES